MLRLLATVELGTVLEWLGVYPEQPPVRLSEALPGGPRTADLVVRVGPMQVVHVEFTIRPEPGFADRMVDYRARLMRREPGCVIRQYVVVLAGGRVPNLIRNGDDFAMRLNVVYLRQHDPQELLRDPVLAPLAVLARSPRPSGHVEALRAALRVLSGVEDADCRTKLVDVATVLAAVHIDADTIDAARKEAGMPFNLAETVGGRSLVAKGEALGEARGEARGEIRKMRSMLETLLRRRFGADPRISAVAERLAGLPEADALDEIDGADSLDTLLAD